MTETSIVRQIQADCLDKNQNVSDLLRKTMLVARKLGSKEILSWVNDEMKGYNNGVPEYRILRGTIIYRDDFSGNHFPINFRDEKQQKLFTERGDSSSIAELEVLLSTDNGNDILAIGLPHNFAMKLIDVFQLPNKPFLQVQKSQLVKILDSVRNKILDWALELEEKEILGEGLAFSNAEKQASSHIEFHIGQMVNSQLQGISKNSPQSLTISNQQKTDIKGILAKIDSKVTDTLSSTDKKQLDADVGTIDKQLNSPSPKPGIIKESLSSIKRIVESSTTAAIGAPIITEIIKILPTLF